MARPKGIRIKKECKNCNKEFEVPPYLEKQKFCSNLCAQQFKGKDKSWLKKREGTCLKKYGTKVASQSKEVQDKLKQSYLENLGVDNPFKSKKVRDKAKKTIKEKYGYEVATKNKEIAKKLSESLKGIKHDRTNWLNLKWGKIQNYYKETGMEPLFTKEYLEENKLAHHEGNKFKFKCNKCDELTEVSLSNGYLPSCKCSYYQYYSVIEDEVYLFLKSILDDDIEIYRNRRDILDNRQEIDIFIPKHNLAIEINGVYWHSESLGKYRNYHLYKTEKCKQKGIHLIHILDYEWLFKKPILESIIRNKLGKNENKIYARKCEIKKIEDNKVVRKFLDENHIQGYTHSPINLGLYYNNELVSLMTFGKSRFKKNSNEYELIRFCNKLNYSIMGGSSKLLKHFEKHYQPDDHILMSFSDRRFFEGGMYEKLGFTMNKVLPPSYIYWKDNIIKNRMSCQKHKLNKLLDKFDSNLTEYENMRNNGWRRVWDSGNIKWKKGNN